MIGAYEKSEVLPQSHAALRQKAGIYVSVVSTGSG
jgi:hypothetical protein